MRENVLDVLMYLFQSYIAGELDLDSDQELLKDELSEAGFPPGDINKAFAWLEGLAERRNGGREEVTVGHTPLATRVLTEREQERLDRESHGFLLFLEQIGVLDPTTRELVIDRVMALDRDEIDLDRLKWVVLMVLFDQPGREEAFAWMEDLVLNESSLALH